jgi:glycerol-3-phosphate dehydrogenase
MMWHKGWRDAVWSQLDREWDLIVIGGGITGVGIFRAAVSSGLKVLLVEAQDFAFGTSSRSSKLVHGGFRYLFNHQYNVTFESVKQRQRLLRESPHLITPIRFNLPNYRRYNYPSWVFRFGLVTYDLMAPKWDHRVISPGDFLDHLSGINQSDILKIFQYSDAVLDDVRLVLRIIRETTADGGTALNYAFAERLLRDNKGTVYGIRLRDTAVENGRTIEIKARAVVNAAGPWTDQVRHELNVPPRLRLLRGSHLVFDRTRFPVHEAVTFFHPQDRRAMFVIPWEGATLVGTTDIDHSASDHPLDAEPFADEDEISYILSGIHFLFPHLSIKHSDVISTFSGLRPVINTGAATPSKESRAHQVWNEHGLITVSGGKLTTFRIMALDTLRMACLAIGKQVGLKKNQRMLKRDLSEKVIISEYKIPGRILGRYGLEAQEFIHSERPEERLEIGSLPASWSEVRYAAAQEGVVHLDDLLLRRSRIGLLLRDGGKSLLPRVRKIVQTELSWSDSHWEKEKARYMKICRCYYSPGTQKR